MSTLQYVHFSSEIWGAFFCIIAMVIVLINRDFDRKGSSKLAALLMCSALLMTSDALAWMFRGVQTDAGYYIVRVSNFTAFLFGFLTMPLVAEYITHIIQLRSHIEGLYWKYIEWLLFLLGTTLLIVNSFNNFIYAFNENNVYYRMQFGSLPGVVAFAGIVLTLGVVFQYIGYLHTFEKVATIIYLILPVVAVVVQMLVYGFSFTYISLIISSLVLFISYEVNHVNYNIEKERKLTEERIRLFNQQIQPHFIFNSLSVIKYLCLKSPEEARQAIDEFSGYMRSSTDLMNATDCVPVERELDLVKHYVYMQKKHYGDSINFEFDIRDTDFCVPPFSIQTEVENALRHGLRSKVIENGTMAVRTRNENGTHIVEVEDNGAGFDTSILDNTGEGHVGIRNTRQRLRLMCGGTLDIQSEIGKGTKATISIREDGKKNENTDS